MRSIPPRAVDLTADGRILRVGRWVRLWREPTRGEVVGVAPHADGPTYLVRWSDTNSVTRHFARELEVA